MKHRTKYLIAGLAVVGVVGAGAGIGVAATGDDDEAERSITGVELEQASEAALEHTGGGRVTDTEIGDEESLYEVEVTLSDGTQVDVQLDENFTVVGVEDDDQPDDD
jgi:uncharacterized membrane protein YkoI